MQHIQDPESGEPDAGGEPGYADRGPDPTGPPEGADEQRSEEERTDREPGGPTSPAEEPEEDVTGGATGTRPSGLDPEQGE